MHTRDFTFEIYKELCKTIKNSGYEIFTMKDYFLENKKKNRGDIHFIIMRHDVDTMQENALKMAKIENEHGISATYYFRVIKKVFKPDIIKEIAGLGHEIGYHYEVLDKAKGDFETAIRLFEEELNKFRKICNVKTVCMHGNAVSPWNNRDLWEKYDFKDFGITGEPYLSLDYTKIIYLSDTGRRWDSRFSVKDVVDASFNPVIERIKSTDDIIRMINEEYVDQICILAHPDRWSDSFGAWVKELAWQNVKNVGKAILVRRAY